MGGRSTLSLAQAGLPSSKMTGHQPCGGDFSQDLVGPSPLEFSRLGFDAAPVDTLPYPAETGATQTVQRLLPIMRGVVLLEGDGYTEKGNLGRLGRKGREAQTLPAGLLESFSRRSRSVRATSTPR